MAIDHFGLTPHGESWKAIEDGTIEFSGSATTVVSLVIANGD